MKEAWDPTFPAGYSPGPQPFTAMGDMHLSITQAENDAIIAAAAIEAATKTNAPASERTHAEAVAIITTIRGGFPASAMVPPIGTASGAASIKSATNVKIQNIPPTRSMS